MNRNIAVSICTPIYNRVKFINRLYESLCEQTIFDFEWIIVDDGSEDNLEREVNRLIEKKNNFNIFYLYKNNGGKHTAINLGITKAKGRFFFIVDSDDYLVPNAIERILFWENTILDDKMICGLGFCKGYDEQKVVGTTFKNKYIDATSLERNKFNITGDKAEVFYTDVLRNYPFPEYKNEKFLTEAVVWDRIANDGYKLRWINEIIYICEYLEDGLSSKWNSNLKNSPQGYTLFLKQKIHFNKLTFKEIYLLAKSYHVNIENTSRIKTCRLLDINCFMYFFYDFLFFIKRCYRAINIRLQK